MSNALARRLRQQSTPAEISFWIAIHTLRQGGWHFRRQAPIGPYIVDFVCKRAKLVFEIDGDSHYTDEGIARDAIRTDYLESRGYRVVRFTNLDLINPDGVFEMVSGLLEDTPSHPPPDRGRS